MGELKVMTLGKAQGEITRLKAEKAELVEAAKECLVVVNECYEATGHFRVAKSSKQRMKIEAAIARAKSTEGGEG